MTGRWTIREECTKERIAEDNLGASLSISVYLSLSWIISDYLGLSQAISGYLGLSRTLLATWGYLRLSRAIFGIKYQGASRSRREQVITI